MKSSQFLGLFIPIAIGYLILLLAGFSELSSWIKPLLIPPLILAVFFHSNFWSKKLLLAALSFSWVGDVVLIFAPLSNWYFISGLLAFLSAHLVYFWIFRKENQTTKTAFNTFLLVSLVIVIAFLIGILSLLLPHLGDMKIPVAIYAITICSMLSAALIGFQNFPNTSKYWILGGAMSFVLSDTILAFNKFHQPIEMASFMIMLSYLLAQYSITTGILKIQSKN